MNLQIQAVNFNAQQSLLEYIETKLEKLTQYSDKIIEAKVFLKVENSSSKQNKQSEIILHIPGDEVVVKKQGQSFEECIDVSLDTLKKLIIKNKEKSK